MSTERRSDAPGPRTESVAPSIGGRLRRRLRTPLLTVRVIGWIGLFLWGFGMICHGDLFAAGGGRETFLRLAFGATWISLAGTMPRAHSRRSWRLAALGLTAILVISWGSASPSNEREWATGHTRTPRITFAPSPRLESGAENPASPTRVTIEGIRNHRYPGPGEVIETFETRTIELDGVRDLDYIVIPFSAGWRGPAHTMLSFGFEGSVGLDGLPQPPPPRLVISIEARRERGEEYTPIAGLYRQFEVLFVIADEQDAIALRVDHTDDPVQVHRTRATPEQARRLLVALLREAETLAEEPAFYHSFLRNCTTGIVGAVARVLEESVPLDLRLVFPGYSDAIAHERGWLVEKGPLEEVRRRATVSPVSPHPDSREWSRALRNRR